MILQLVHQTMQSKVHRKPLSSINESLKEMAEMANCRMNCAEVEVSSRTESHEHNEEDG